MREKKRKEQRGENEKNKKKRGKKNKPKKKSSNKTIFYLLKLKRAGTE
jgi:hypothetical protein